MGKRMPSLPVKLRALRAQKDWTVRQAAEKIGTTVDNLSRIERGIRHPRARTLRKFAEAYGVDLESLLTLEDVSLPKAS
jgi:XRE family transcriptional regulator, regulator of sulfur utilization